MSGSLVEWCRDPVGSPPVPFDSPVVGVAGLAYAVGSLPSDLLLADLTRAGVTYSRGRGNGYAIQGRAVDRYVIGDLVADVFDDSARALSAFLASDEQAVAVSRARGAQESIPFADRPEIHDARAAASRRTHAEERLFFAERRVDHGQLVQQAASLSATARAIRVHQSVRFEAVRRFVQPLAAPMPDRSPSSREEVLAFLRSLPPRRVKRSALPALATAAGLSVGSRTLYALAPEVLGAPSRNRGEWYFHPCRGPAGKHDADPR